MKKFLIFIWETLRMVIISLAIILPIRYFLVEPFYVKGASMEPNFYDHEYLVVDRLTYRRAEPKRGEVVVFKYPKNPQEYYIKRFIGLPGETVEVRDEGVYIYNQEHPEGFRLDETYLPKDLDTIASNPAYARVELGSNEYFVLGDNRLASQDSRVFGPVDRSFIVGRVVFRGWPFDRFGFLTAVNY